MVFKKIEIYGFKSFADKLEVDFSGGITCIVGPNGCGKSNVADAVRWVLGNSRQKPFAVQICKTLSSRARNAVARFHIARFRCFSTTLTRPSPLIIPKLFFPANYIEVAKASTISTAKPRA